MSFRKELVEPWGMLLAAGSAGFTWAIQVPVPAAVGVGLMVLVARAGIAGLNRKDEPRPVKIAEVAAQSEEWRWLNRAEIAADGFTSLSDSFSGGPLASRVRELGPSIHETVETLRRLAGRATTVGKALEHLDQSPLTLEKTRLHEALETAEDDVRTDLEQSLQAIQAQEDVHARLSGARNKLIAQLQSGALGLDSLVARVVELSTAIETDLSAETGTISELGDQLEGIRRGVVETEETTRRTLG